MESDSKPERSPARLARWVTAHPGRALAIVGVAVAGAFSLSLVDGPFDPNKVGNLGEWVAGIATLSAVLVALFGVHYEIEQRRNDEILDQASRVFAWAEHTGRSGEVSGFKVRLRNNSDTPVSDPKVWYRLHVPTREDNAWEPKPVEFDLGSGSLIPGNHTYGEVRVPGRETRLDLKVTHRDSRGRWWLQDSAGRLEQLTGPPDTSE